MGFVGDILHYPRRLWLRKALFRIHLWLGVLFSLYLVVIALSGSVLVYKDELARWTLPRDLHPYDASHGTALASVMEHFKVAEPGGSVSLLQVPTPVLPAFTLIGRDSHGHAGRWIADRSTGAVQAAPRTWMDTVHDLHYFLLLPSSWGMQANAIGAAALSVLAVTGIILWWPGVRSWVLGLRLGLRANTRRVSYDLHNVIGFWTLAILLWWAFSGVYFGFYRQVTAAVSFVSPIRGMKSPEAGALPAATAIGHVSLGQVIEAAYAASPNGKLWSISDPSLRTSEAYILIDRAAPGDFSHRDIVRVRTADARVISVWHYGELQSPGDWLLWSMHPLHFGTLWGPVFKLVWFLLGLSLAVLTVTGLMMYWNRFQRRAFRPTSL